MKISIEMKILQEAEKSIRFYQSLTGKDGDFERLQSEINKLKSTIGNTKLENHNGNPLKWSVVEITSEPDRKAMKIGLVLAAINQLCGCFAMLQYTANIFKEAGSSMSPNISGKLGLN